MSQPSVCELPAKTGIRAGLPARGTKAGYMRHWRAGEPACRGCLAAWTNWSTKWAAENPDAHRATNKRWRDANPEKVREHGRAKRIRNRVAIVEKNRRRRALLRKVTVASFTIDQLEGRLSMFAGCWMCGGEADTVDHVKPLAAGVPHILANLRPACQPCNSSKGATWPLAHPAA